MTQIGYNSDIVSLIYSVHSFICEKETFFAKIQRYNLNFQ